MYFLELLLIIWRFGGSLTPLIQFVNCNKFNSKAKLFIIIIIIFLCCLFYKFWILMWNWSQIELNGEKVTIWLTPTSLGSRLSCLCRHCCCGISCFFTFARWICISFQVNAEFETCACFWMLGSGKGRE